MSKSPYRSEIEALRERKESLEQEVARLREQTTHLDALRAREAEIARQLAEIDARMAERVRATKRPLPLLDQITVASPCNESWGEMLGDERVRFCLKCEKNVYNLSSMSRDDAEALLRERMNGELCVRFYQRADGTIMTQDCPVGATKKRRKKVALALAGAGAMALAAASMLQKTTCRPMQGQLEVVEEPGVEVKMGDVAVAPPPVQPTSETPHRPVQGGVSRPPQRMGRMKLTP